jgi:hypothetical protein
MAHWIGVASSLVAVERLRSQDHTWWCLPKEATPGDRMLVYVARSKIKQQVADNEAGIVAEFSVTGPEPAHLQDCRAFGGSYAITMPVKIELATRFAVPLRLAEMKKDLVMTGATCVRRSFQSTCFSLSPQEYSRIRKLLSRKNETSGNLPTTPEAG